MPTWFLLACLLPAEQEGSEDLPPFIITERGDFTLAEVLAKSRPPPQQQKILLHDLACALSQLHSMGLVQMDIRPANIMFFGCAKKGGACMPLLDCSGA